MAEDLTQETMPLESAEVEDTSGGEDTAPVDTAEVQETQPVQQQQRQAPPPPPREEQRQAPPPRDDVERQQQRAAQGIIQYVDDVVEGALERETPQPIKDAFKRMMLPIVTQVAQTQQSIAAQQQLLRQQQADLSARQFEQSQATQPYKDLKDEAIRLEHLGVPQPVIMEILQGINAKRPPAQKAPSQNLRVIQGRERADSYMETEGGGATSMPDKTFDKAVNDYWEALYPTKK